MKKNDRTFRMYLDDKLVAMSRISEYIAEHSLESFKQEYKTVNAVSWKLFNKLAKSYLEFNLQVSAIASRIF